MKFKNRPSRKNYGYFFDLRRELRHNRQMKIKRWAARFDNALTITVLIAVTLILAFLMKAGLDAVADHLIQNMPTPM